MAEIGKVGVWLRASPEVADLAGEVERLGYGALWLGGSPDASALEALLAATARLTVGSSIVNIRTTRAREVAAGFHRLEAAYPGRLILGIGAGHKERDDDYRTPYQGLVEYLDALDEAGVPRERRALAALGPRVLELSRDRSAGALPYLVTPEHTRRARALLGPDALLVTEHKVAVGDDPEALHELARRGVKQYLRLSNYVSNLRRLGFSEEDLTPPGSDRLVDELAYQGDAESVAKRLAAHLEAGADQVAIQPLGDPLPALRALAGRLHP
jgi:probable F420-dependent oxidoreductase